MPVKEISGVAATQCYLQNTTEKVLGIMNHRNKFLSKMINLSADDSITLRGIIPRSSIIRAK
jgi:hypothetical protein